VRGSCSHFSGRQWELNPLVGHPHALCPVRHQTRPTGGPYPLVLGGHLAAERRSLPQPCPVYGKCASSCAASLSLSPDGPGPGLGGG
jgi:hypothetical protein